MKTAKSPRCVFVVQGNYGHGWEDLTENDDRKLALDDLRAYRENAPEPVRLVTRRVKVEGVPRKLECAHVDTCLPDYWRGDSRPWVAIPVYKGIHLADVKRAIMDELRMGAVGGSDRLARLLSDCPEPDDALAAEIATERAYAAVNRLRPAVPRARRLFTDLEATPADYDGPDVMAFFVFVEA